MADKVEHFKAMPNADIPAFMKELAVASPTTGRDTLRFTIYNAVRSSETRKAVWTIPGERMKAKETHMVPLSKPAASILRRCWKLRPCDGGLVFSNNGEVGGVIGLIARRMGLEIEICLVDGW